VSAAQAVQEENSAGSTKHTAAPLIDCDIHPRSIAPLRDLFAHMPAAWARRLEHLADRPYSDQFPSLRLLRGHNGERRDAHPPHGPTGSDPAFLSVDLLDRFDIQYGLLVDLDASSAVQEAAEVELSVVLASALNDYALDKWHDSRLRHAIVVPPFDPIAAALEVRRLGPDPRVSAVMLPMTTIRFGNRWWDPLYEAAGEYDLPLVTHDSGGEIAGYRRMASFPVSTPNTYSVVKTQVSMLAASEVSSLVLGGAFGRHPKLKFLFIEYGFPWVVPLMWRLDDVWRSHVGTTSPKPWPRELVHDHVFFATQPVPGPRDSRELINLIEFNLADNLLFATDYPHFDQDSPDAVLKGLSAATREKIFSSNARSVLRLPLGVGA
jgi:predicted TIM-barrel fold metal-dependent hydrolase